MKPKTLIKRLAVRAAYHVRLNRYLAKAANSPLIMLYHRVDHHTSSLLHRDVDTISPVNFEHQLRHLEESGFRFVPLSALAPDVDGAALPRGRLAVITFDDGYQDLYDHAFPILKSRGIPFTLFYNSATASRNRLLWIHQVLHSMDLLGEGRGMALLAGLLGAPQGLSSEDLLGMLIRNRNRSRIAEITVALMREAGLDERGERQLAESLYLTQERISEMVAHGMSLECHTHDHWPLPSLTSEELAHQVRACMDHIEDSGFKRPSFMSVPFGIGAEFAASILTEHQLNGLCTSRPALLDKGDCLNDLPRVHSEGDIMSFATFLSRHLLRALRTN